jgi:hypothetical protein
VHVQEGVGLWLLFKVIVCTHNRRALYSGMAQAE